MKKNILILDTGKEWGGGTNSLLELLKRVNKKKYSFSVLFYINYKKGNDSCIKKEIEKLGIEFLLLEQEKPPFPAKILKEIVRILFFFSKGIQKRLIFYIDYKSRIKKDAKRISAILINRKIDLIYMNNQPSSNLEGIIASKMTGIPAIQHSRIETGLNPCEVRAVNQWLSKIICVSEGVKDVFLERGVDSSKCVVVYNGINAGTEPRKSPDEVRSEWGIQDDDVLIGTVGSLIKRKRIKDLIEAVHMIEGKTGRLVKCLVVGKGPEWENLLKLAKKRGLDEKVIFTGFQPDAVSYINAMEIFVMPSEREGFPRVVLEAMLMQKPVIAAKIKGTKELIVNNETGMLFPKGNTKELAKYLKELLLSPSIGKDMGKAGKKRVVENFSIEKYVNNVQKVFGEVLEANNVR